MSNGDIKIYILTFFGRDVNIATLNQYLFDSADIIAFWNYIPLVYCVKSRATATDLAYKLTPFFPNGNFLVAEITPNNINGILPNPAWDWFYLNHHEKHRPPALTSGLAPHSALSTSSSLLALLAPPSNKK